MWVLLERGACPFGVHLQPIEQLSTILTILDTCGLSVRSETSRRTWAVNTSIPRVGPGGHSSSESLQHPSRPFDLGCKARWTFNLAMHGLREESRL